MFKNTIAIKSIEGLKEKRSDLSLKKRDVEDKLSAIRSMYKITDNNIKNRSVIKAPKEVWDLRKQYSDELTELNNNLSLVNKDIREFQLKVESERNVALMGVFKEIFNDAQRFEIFKEIDRRRNGETPYPLGLDFKELQRYKDGYFKYREVVKEKVEKMIDFRIMLTGIIEKGCEKFGNAEFLKFIRPLNQLIIPIQELKKEKQKLLL